MDKNDVMRAINTVIKSCEEKEADLVPITIIKSHPVIDGIFNTGIADIEKLRSDGNELIKALKKRKDDMWAAVKQQLLSEGLITEEEGKKDVGLTFKDGVLFKEKL